MDPYRAPLPPRDCPACRARSDAWSLAWKTLFSLFVVLLLFAVGCFAFLGFAFGSMDFGIGRG